MSALSQSNWIIIIIIMIVIIIIIIIINNFPVTFAVSLSVGTKIKSRF